MAHEVEQMFSVKETPWHGLGRIIHEAPSVEEGIRLAGLDWKVELRKLHFLKDGNQGETYAEARHKAVIRTSDQSLLGVVGPGYRPLQNREAFDFFNPFLEAGQCTLETAGSLRGGARVWILARLNRDPIEVVKGDAVQKFLMLSNSHDGLMAVRVGFTPIRVVCANTLAMAHDSQASRLMRVAHTRGVVESLDQVASIIDAANARFEATAEQYKLLARTGVDDRDLKRYVSIVFKPQLDRLTKEGKAKSEERLMGEIRALFEDGRGSRIKGVRGTLWGAYNAVTERMNYDVGTSQDGRINGLWFGDLEKQNRHALASAVEMAEAA